LIFNNSHLFFASCSSKGGKTKGREKGKGKGAKDQVKGKFNYIIYIMLIKFIKSKNEE
jgi:hypothetical protein